MKSQHFYKISILMALGAVAPTLAYSGGDPKQPAPVKVENPPVVETPPAKVETPPPRGKQEAEQGNPIPQKEAENTPQITDATGTVNKNFFQRLGDRLQKGRINRAINKDRKEAERKIQEEAKRQKAEIERQRQAEADRNRTHFDNQKQLAADAAGLNQTTNTYIYQKRTSTWTSSNSAQNPGSQVPGSQTPGNGSANPRAESPVPGKDGTTYIYRRYVTETPEYQPTTTVIRRTTYVAPQTHQQNHYQEVVTASTSSGSYNLGNGHTVEGVYRVVYLPDGRVVFEHNSRNTGSEDGKKPVAPEQTNVPNGNAAVEAPIPSKNEKPVASNESANVPNGNAAVEAPIPSKNEKPVAANRPAAPKVQVRKDRVKLSPETVALLQELRKPSSERLKPGSKASESSGKVGENRPPKKPKKQRKATASNEKQPVEEQPVQMAQPNKPQSDPETELVAEQLIEELPANGNASPTPEQKEATVPKKDLPANESQPPKKDSHEAQPPRKSGQA
jgi:hypothetical protein